MNGMNEEQPHPTDSSQPPALVLDAGSRHSKNRLPGRIAASLPEFPLRPALLNLLAHLPNFLPCRVVIRLVHFEILPVIGTMKNLRFTAVGVVWRRRLLEFHKTYFVSS